jgi:hypothetical protein
VYDSAAEGEGYRVNGIESGSDFLSPFVICGLLLFVGVTQPVVDQPVLNVPGNSSQRTAGRGGNAGRFVPSVRFQGARLESAVVMPVSAEMEAVAIAVDDIHPSVATVGFFSVPVLAEIADDHAGSQVGFEVL